MPLRFLLLLLATASLTSCVRLRFALENDQTPIPIESQAELQPQSSDLGDVLDTLGAPHLVLEALNGNDEIVLAYVWSETDVWGLQVSFGVFSQYARSARLRYDSTAFEYEGVVVILGQDLVVRSIRRGSLVDLLGDGTSGSVRSLLSTFVL